MNKRANLYLNIIEEISFILAFLLITVMLKYELSTLLKNICFISGALFGLLFIAIELFLFILMNNKVKVIYLFYLIIDILSVVLINAKYPFSALTVLLIFSFIKDLERILLVEKIYIPKEFDYYCKMYGIKVKDFKKKKKAVTKVSKKKELIEIPNEEYDKQTTKKKTAKRRAQPEATI